MPANNNPYHRLEAVPLSPSASLPSQPPDYQDLLDSDPDLRHGPVIGSSSIEQFEIDDSFYPEPVEREPLLVRASLVTKRFAHRFSARVINPVSRLVDPIYEGYKYFQMQYEKSILRLGNPLVVKRLLYVAFVLVIIFFVSKYNTNESIKGTSGGTFTNGIFYDIDMLEDSIKSYINPKLMKENLEYFSSMPHISGTKGDLTLAKFIERYMTNNGINSIEFNELQSFLNYPDEKNTYVRLADGTFFAKLHEGQSNNMESLAYNPNALNTNEQIEGNFIFANYGTLDDFEELKKSNVDVKDNIVLIRYGGTVPESTKLYYAQQNHAKAVIFISPQYEIEGKNNTKIIQRTNVGLTRMGTGDILTPGWASDDGYVTRITWDKSETTPKIPSIPISYKDGERLLSNLVDSPGANFDYQSSGDGSGVKLQMKISNANRPVHQIWNVIGSIEGREQGEKGVIIGAARDSSCYGTIGSNTGTVALLEMIKVFTSLQRKHQWSPSRSIYFVSFDATEYNLAGSAEWVENKKELLKKSGYLYVDLSDLIAGDELSVQAHPFLRDVVSTRMQKVLSNAKGSDGNPLTLYDLFTQQNKNTVAIKNNFLEYKNYVPFINLVNVPSLEIKYKGVKYPKNSCFDNFEYFENMKIDKSMEKHAELVELISRIVLRCAEAPFIPYNFIDLGTMLDAYIDDLSKFSKDIIDKLDQPNKPILHFDFLLRAAHLVKDNARRYHDVSNQWQAFIRESRGIEPSLYAVSRRKWNDNMLDFNAKFLIKEVHPARPGYANILFGVPFEAPAVADEYEWNTFPKIRELLLQKKFGMVQEEIDRVGQVLHEAINDFVSL
ncbi:uncharacterized protein SPAPADRAFT_51890 [Spathaspora passalidarum NRRL Y-27907]|uniref:Uncharacterized protein n=1 Tax=Spathaspora passalidarum (strain NRRL Y-27907 / 11-Y1) TaxID=619300 RepID=G3ASJ2_SPAPN|nr:uncharacterized protein SPAPADRAFT_51890 [Spathaspora passalidarum NRRL Y-27907]EGW30678.1 hypothetical protein SPAPADRAFT_51890 [Spathaspora passalidarum NRRL Y-27907]